MTRIGKLLAYILRHNPQSVGITLDAHGWADVDELIAGICKNKVEIDRSTLDEVVAVDSKGRFSYSEDGTKIRANQGHSIPVDVEMEEKTPPAVLYHGTAEKYIDGIRQRGIEKRTRNFVHLSINESIAKNVGSRHGVPVVLKIDTERMSKDGYRFYLSANGIWQTEFVPYEYVVEVIE